MGWLKIALGVVCFGLGGACIIAAIAVLIFGAVFEASMTGMLGDLFLWRVRWHKD
jgi:hypothetical protein